MKRALKWVGISVGTVAFLAVIFAAFQFFKYSRAAGRTYDVAPPAISATDDSATIAEGARLASVMGCISCHGQQLEGYESDDMGPVGSIVGTNLTTGSGGEGNEYSDGELARAIRSGLKNDGTSVRWMPSADYTWLPDNVVTALVSFIRSLPPVDNEPPETSVGPVGRMLSSLGMMPILAAAAIDHDAPRPNVPDPEPTAQYGYFIARGCVGCHGETLSGGPFPGAPPDLGVPLNITPHETGIAGWTYEQFVQVLQSGRGLDGRELDEMMEPAPFLSMTETELRAVYAYLMELTPLEFGGR